MEKKHLFIGLASALGVVSVTFISLFVWKSVSSGNTPEPEPQVVEHFVTFESNGGTHIVTQRVKDGEKAVEPDNPTKVVGGSTYTFDGWFDNPELTGASYNFDKTTVTNDVTLYARWIGGSIIKTYKIDFQGENCSTTLDLTKEYEPDTQVEFTINIDDETKYKLPAKIYASGYKTFEYNPTNGTVNLVIGDSNVFVVAKAEEKTPTAKHTVSFVLNGGEGTADPIEVTEGELIPAEKIPQNPTKAGYPFEGWSTSEISKDIFKFDKTTIMNNLILYAWWGNIKQYTVHFVDINDTTKSISEDQTVAYNHKVQRPVVPTKDGYTFDNWYVTTTVDPSNIYKFDSPLTDSSKTEITIYGRFTINQYRVTYVANGGVVGRSFDDVNYNGTIATAPNVTKDGEIVTPEWYDNSSFTGNPFVFGTGSSATKVTSNITLYAKYVAKSFENDPWAIFLDEINNKSYTQIAEGAYAEDYASTEGKQANTFVGLTRSIKSEIDDEEYTVLVVDENRNATATEPKFTFMITNIDSVSSFDADRNFYPESYIDSQVSFLEVAFPTIVKQHVQLTQIDCCDPVTGEIKDDVNRTIYLPSATQIFGEGSYPTEDSQFAYFKNGEHTAVLDGAWLRTPNQVTQEYVLYVNNGAVNDDAHINDRHNVTPVFVIK